MKTFSLRARLTLLLAVAALIALGIAARVVDWRADTEMKQRFDASLLARAQAFAALVHASGNDVEVDAIADRTATFPSAVNDWYAVQCHGKVIAQSHPAPPRIAAEPQPRFIDTRLADGRELRVVVLRFRPGADDDADAQHFETTPVAQTCELRYALDRGSLEELLHTLDWILLGSILGACALVLLLTPWLVRRGLRPLAVLDRAMAQIGPEAPGRRLPPSGTRELAPLVTRFNEVLGRMDEGLARERQFASGLAHELRTRLAELRALIDVETHYPSGGDPQALLGEIGSIGSELEATVTALLQLTRIESGLENAQREPIELAALLARVLVRHDEARSARGLRFARHDLADPGPLIEADPALLEIVLDNLIGNAVAYAPHGSSVELTVTADSVTIANVAPALTDTDLAYLGQRFWRKHDGAGEEVHAGLGLALAAAAARAMGMTLSFELAEGALRAWLRWRA